MAIEDKVETRTLTASADYSAYANRFKAVKIDTTGGYQAILVSVLGARADGILTNNPISGAAAEVAEDGHAKAQAGAAIATAGLELTPDATGRLIGAASTNFVCAISLEAATAAGDFIGVKLCGPYAKP